MFANTKKNILFITASIIFFTFAISCTATKSSIENFVTNNHVEDKSEKRNYLLKTDGTKVYGNKINWQKGMIVKNTISVDDQKFSFSEIKGHRSDNYFFIRFGSNFLKRIVHGKINIYTTTSVVTDMSSGYGMPKNHYTEYYYMQQGENGELVLIKNKDSIKDAVSTCPQSVSMIDISSSQIKKATKENPNYLNQVFETYNNCK